RSGASVFDNALCSEVVACTEREPCEDSECYCGPPPGCSPPGGACREEIEAAAGTGIPLAVGAARNDASTALGKASIADACRRERCSEVCTPTETAGRRF
ncbi:MAG: hypothetical protein ABW321_31760, partial [Polyangiales bacterium]